MAALQHQSTLITDCVTRKVSCCIALKSNVKDPTIDRAVQSCLSEAFWGGGDDRRASCLILSEERIRELHSN